MSKNTITLLAVGDNQPARKHEEGLDPEVLFDPTIPTLKQADILFGHLETPMANSGRMELWRYKAGDHRIGPENVRALAHAGFHVMSFPSNHHLDWGEEAMLETVEQCAKKNIKLVGVGKNIAEARQPVILERDGTKVAFLAYCSVLPKGYEAGEDKPGCAPLRVITSYDFFEYQPATPPKVISHAHKADLAAMVEDVKKAKAKADIVVLANHWGVHFIPAVLAMYQQEMAYAAIDAGADLILGTHPHILKGIEIYKGKAIFYSLGQFVSPSEREKARPAQANLGVRGTTDEYPDFHYPPDSRKSMIAKCVISNKKVERFSFMPVVIDGRAQPHVLPRSDSRSGKIFDWVEWSSEHQQLNAKFSWEGDEIVVSSM